MALLRVAANDPTGIASVVFGVDGSTLATVTAPAYEMTWDSSTFKDGNHTLTATATSQAGIQATASLQVTTHNGVASGQGGCSTTGGSLSAWVILVALLATKGRRRPVSARE
jgi:uncharacterized protein (TIGR03382 family)